MPDDEDATPDDAPDHPDRDRQIDLRLDAVRARFPDRHDDAELAQVRERIAETVDNARALRAVPLANADAPAGPFVPYRAE